jgi:hypothetical protein
MRRHTLIYRRSLHGIGRASADTVGRPPAPPWSARPPTACTSRRREKIRRTRAVYGHAPATIGHALADTIPPPDNESRRCRAETITCMPSPLLTGRCTQPSSSSGRLSALPPLLGEAAMGAPSQTGCAFCSVTSLLSTSVCRASCSAGTSTNPSPGRVHLCNGRS